MIHLLCLFTVLAMNSWAPLSDQLPNMKAGWVRPNEETAPLSAETDGGPVVDSDSTVDIPDLGQNLEQELFGPATGNGSAQGPPLDLSVEQIRLVMGGRAYLAIQYRALQDILWTQQALTSPSLLDLFWDARPTDRVRAFVSGRLDFDFSVADLQNLPTLFPRQQTRLRLDQIWLKFDLDRSVFLTFGKQRIRWGSGRVWNPTDFLNAQILNPLDVFDRRLGVTLAKIHVPIESNGSNLYFILTLDSANLLARAGYAARIELLLFNTEVAGSVALQPERPLRFGLDVSSGIGAFDLHSELAFRFGDQRPFFTSTENPDEIDGGEWVQARRPDVWYTQALIGAETSWVYAEDAFATFGIEYFWNQLGYPSPALYGLLFSSGAFQPLYLGEHYLSGYVVLPSPGPFDNLNLVVTTLTNLSDGSWLSRGDAALRLLRVITLNTWLVLHYGRLGEFRLPIEIPADSGIPGLEMGLSLPPPQFELGAALNLDF